MTIEYENIPVVNPSDHDWTRNNLYCMWAGAYGDVKCFVWADSFDDAFEHLVEYLDDHAPGCLTRVDYDAAARELGYDSYAAAETHSPDTYNDGNLDRIREIAETDMTIIGHTTLKNGDAIPSWEWGGDEISDKCETFDAVKAVCVAADEQEEAS